MYFTQGVFFIAAPCMYYGALQMSRLCHDERTMNNIVPSII